MTKHKEPSANEETTPRENLDLRPAEDAAPALLLKEEHRPAEAPRPVVLLSDVFFPLPSLLRAFLAADFPVRVWCAEQGRRAALEAAAKTVEHRGPFAPPELKCLPDGPLAEEALREAFSDAAGAVVLSPVEPQGRASRATDHPAWVKKIVRAAEEIRLRKLVYLSSAAVEEKTRTRCLSEAAAAEAAVAGTPCEDFIIRAAPLWGPGAPWVEKLVRDATSPLLWLGVWSYGEVPVQPLHVRDFARAMVRLFAPTAAAPAPGVYRLGGEEATTLLKLQDRLLLSAGRWKVKFHLPGFLMSWAAMLTVPFKRLLGGRLRERAALPRADFTLERNDLRRLTGEKATPLAEMTAEALRKEGDKSRESGVTVYGT